MKKDERAKHRYRSSNGSDFHGVDPGLANSMMTETRNVMDSANQSMLELTGAMQDISAAAEMTAQAEQMKVYVVDLARIVGGAGRNAIAEPQVPSPRAS